MKGMWLVAALVFGLLSCTAADETTSTVELFDRALTTARTIESVEERADALTVVFMALVLAGDKSAARQLEPEMIDSVKAIPYAHDRDSLLERIVAMQTGRWIEATNYEMPADMKAYMEAYSADAIDSSVADAREGRVSEAFAVAQSIEDPEKRLWALWHVARSAIESGHISMLQKLIIDTLDTAKTFPDDKSRSEALAIVGWTQTLAGDHIGAETTFGEAMVSARSLSSNDDRAEALGYIVAARYAAGNRQAAEAALRDELVAEESATSSEALQKIVAWHVKIGDTLGALATARAIEDDIERAFALVQIAAEQSAAGGGVAEETLREAILLLGKARASELARAWLHSVLRAALMRPDERRNLLTVIAALGEHYHLWGWDSSEMAVTMAPAIVSAIDDFIAATREIDAPEGLRILLLWALAEPLLLAGDQPVLQRLAREALAILHPAMAVGKRSIGVVEFGKALRIIALMQVEGGDHAGALATVDEALAYDRESNETSYDDGLLQIAAAAHARAGAMPLAIATAEKIEDAASRVRGLLVVALGGRFAWRLRCCL